MRERGAATVSTETMVFFNSKRVEFHPRTRCLKVCRAVAIAFVW